MSIETIKSAIRDIPDFPKKGIIFKDITPLLGNAGLLKETLGLLAENYKGRKIDKVAAVEARGFIFGAALAEKLGAGFIPVRKKGKLPYKTVYETYQLEYGNDTLEIHEDAVSKGDRVLLVDDLLATGGTAKAVCSLVNKAGGEILSLTFVIELTFLKGIEKLKGYDVFTLIKF